MPERSLIFRFFIFAFLLIWQSCLNIFLRKKFSPFLPLKIILFVFVTFIKTTATFFFSVDLIYHFSLTVQTFIEAQKVKSSDNLQTHMVLEKLPFVSS